MEELRGQYFAVIDTETTWTDKVMSIGVVIANRTTFEEVDKRYYLIQPECTESGMYSSALRIKQVKIDATSDRETIITHLIKTLQTYHVESVLAYNAAFDFRHLPELQMYEWYDIMRIAAYKQYIDRIPPQAVCCSTGRLKRNYGVESILSLLLDNSVYFESHNALKDAQDELLIMKLVGLPYDEYAPAIIKSKTGGKNGTARHPKKKVGDDTEVVDSSPFDIVQRVQHENNNCFSDTAMTVLRTYTVGDMILHEAFGAGEIKSIVKIENGVYAIIVDYCSTIGETQHLLPVDEKYIKTPQN